MYSSLNHALVFIFSHILHLNYITDVTYLSRGRYRPKGKIGDVDKTTRRELRPAVT